MALLHGFELLPGLRRWPALPELVFSVWGLCCGFLVAVLVMLLWQPRRAVFLDRICISEDDTDLKTLAIFSALGAYCRSNYPYQPLRQLWKPTK